MNAQASSGSASWATAGPWGAKRYTETTIRMAAPRSALPIQGKYMLIAASIAAALVLVRFVLMGAWPVMLFAVLDIGALAVGLYVFSKRPVPEERLSLIDGQVELVRIDHQGRRVRVALPALYRTESYTTVDVQASYDIGNLRLGVSVSNLTGKKYVLPYKYLAQSVVIPGQPRLVFLSLSWCY